MLKENIDQPPTPKRGVGANIVKMAQVSQGHEKFLMLFCSKMSYIFPFHLTRVDLRDKINWAPPMLGVFVFVAIASTAAWLTVYTW